jgi:hypothetical protein
VTARSLRRRRLCIPRVSPTQELTYENGHPITFATPGAPTRDELRRYAEAVQRATTPPPLTREQKAAQRAAMRQRRELFPWAVDW